MSGQPFSKMTGSGNDFVVLDGRTTSPDAWPEARIRETCDRRFGVGADGLVILTPESDSRVRMDFWNCDGSRASMCGNAALCSTRLAARIGLAPGDGMLLVTRAGTFPTRILEPTDQLAELSLPSFPLPAEVPGLALAPGETSPRLATVGVPHLVVEVANLDDPGLMARGGQLRSDPRTGPDGANANFVGPVGMPDREMWGLRTYERGVEAETLACGTGAVAVAVSLAVRGRVRLPLELVSRSGRILHINATLSEGKATDVRLVGEGRLVFTGLL